MKFCFILNFSIWQLEANQNSESPIFTVKRKNLMANVLKLKFYVRIYQEFHALHWCVTKCKLFKLIHRKIVLLTKFSMACRSSGIGFIYSREN
jgi:hypothetical protein